MKPVQVVRLVVTGSMVLGLGVWGIPTAVAAPASSPSSALADDAGIDVLHYRIQGRWSMKSRVLSGQTDIRLQTTKPLKDLELDFLLKTKSVTVDGVSAKFQRSESGRQLLVSLPKAVRAGKTLNLRVRYRDRPRQYRSGYWRAEVATSKSEVALLAARRWFPSHNEPTDKATFRFELTVPKGKKALANGVPGGQRTHGAWQTYTWLMNQPMSTREAFFVGGDYQITRGTEGSVTTVDAVSTRDETYGRAAFKKAAQGRAWLEGKLGPYPFDGAGLVLTGLNSGYSVAQTRPVLSGGGGSRNSGPNGGWDEFEMERLMAYQWFGCSVTEQDRNEGWLAEGFADYMMYRFQDEHLDRTPPDGVVTSQEYLRMRYDYPTTEFWEPVISGGREAADRGTAALVALSNRIGLETMDRLLRAWVQDRAHSTATTKQFTALAEKVSGEDLDEFFQAWLYRSVKPADTVEYGLGQPNQRTPQE